MGFFVLKIIKNRLEVLKNWIDALNLVYLDFNV
jgi:hypothetical protein